MLNRRILTAILYCFLIVVIINAQSDSALIQNLSEYSLYDLLKIKVVTSDKQEEEITEVTANAQVITRDFITKMGFSNYKEILEYITGFYPLDDYHWQGHKNYGVRGFLPAGSPSTLIVLVNGVTQLSDEYSEYPDTKISLPVESIERIEVIYGPMSVMYGNGAFFGAINIITEQHTINDPVSLVSASIGSNQTMKFVFRVAGREKDFVYSVNGGWYQTQGLDVTYGELTSDTALLNDLNVDTETRTKKKLCENRKYAGINLKFKKFYADINYNVTHKGMFDGLPSFGDGNLIKHDAANFMAGFKSDISESWSTRVQAGYHTHLHNVDYEQYFKYYYGLDNKRTSAVDFDINFFLKKDRLNLTLGIYRRIVLDLYQMVDDGYTSLGRAHGEVGIPRNENISTDAFYMQLQYNPVKNLKLSGGIRLEHLEAYKIYYARGLVSLDPSVNRSILVPGNRTIIETEYNPDKNGNTFNYRLAAVYNFNENHTLKLMYGTATKHPSFIDNLRHVLAGDSLLRAQRIETLELNYFACYNQYLHSDVSLFYNNLYDIISATNIYDHDSQTWEITSLNSAGAYRTVGVQASLKIIPLPVLDMNISGIYQKTKNLREGYENINVGNYPELSLYGSISYHKKRVTATFAVRHIGSMYAEWVTESTPYNGTRIGANAGAYTVCDLNLRVNHIFLDNLFGSIRVRNMFDTEIRYPTTKINQWINKGTLGAGREFLLTMGYSF